MFGGQKKPLPSYRLFVSLEPDWLDLYTKAVGAADREEVTDELRNFLNQEDEFNANLWGRRYNFVEDYSPSTGHTARYQTTKLFNGSQVFVPVSEFEEKGFFFHSQSPFVPSTPTETYEERENANHACSLHITESYICNNIFDRHIGGPKVFYDESDYLLRLPTDLIVNFLYDLGRHFSASKHLILVWPDKIVEAMAECNVKYETHCAFEPDELSLRGAPRIFKQRWSGARVADHRKGHRLNYFMSVGQTYFSINLECFHPENGTDRLWVDDDTIT